MKRLAIVVPCYNEEEVFTTTNAQLICLMNNLVEKNKIRRTSYILYVDDGSKDHTWDLIRKANKDSSFVCGLRFAGNRGHQNAVYAGLMKAREDADITISIDADLQDDINVIEEMIDKNEAGADIVYGVRNNRESDSFFKRFTAESFYKLMNGLGAKTIYNHADFRLMSKKACDELARYEECNLFLRGIATDLGFVSDCVYYTRKERMAGESKYPFKKMVAFAIDGITSFSIKPLTLISYLGIAAILFSFVSIIYSLIRHANGYTIEGWTSLFVSIWFLGGVQLLSIGVIGQYVGKNYIETKKRPRYCISEYLGPKV